MAFVKRRIDVTITLKEGDFGGGKGNTVTLTGYRVGVYVGHDGGDAQGVLQCQIYGLPLDMMNQLTVIGYLLMENQGNSISIGAGTDESMTLVWQGIIQTAWADLTNQPDGVLNIIGYSAANIAVTPVNAISYKGSVDAKTIMKDLADKAGYTFENKQGASAILSNVYAPGTLLDQIKSVAKAARFAYNIDKGILAIWPKGGDRGGDMPLISSATGMVGYPTFSSQGMVVTMLYNDAIRLGGKVMIESELTPACGEWTVFNIIHSLESENPNGNGTWFTTIACTRAAGK